MTIEPLISIITVVYNGEKYLEQTIQSVINQTYNNIEYIIIDGGSNDRTLDIIKKYQNHITYWVSEPDNGLYEAMNKGIDIAKGELIGMINSDDWYELSAVDIVVQAYKENPLKRIFHADRFDVKENGIKSIRKFHPSTFKFKYYGMTYNHPSMFVHKDNYIKEKYNTNLKALSDYEFVLKKFIENPKIFYYIQDSYVNYRLDGISAQISLFERLKEGFSARNAAGMGLLRNIFSLSLRSLVFLIYTRKS